MKLTWMIGGEQGSGVDTASVLFGKAVSGAGYFLFGNREYYSTIKNRHSYFELSISDKRINSISEFYDIITTFDAETIFQHFQQAKGYFIYSETNVKKGIDTALSLEPETKKEILGFMSKNSIEPTVQGVINYLRTKGIVVIPVNYEQILREISAELSINMTLAEKSLNTIAASVSFALLGLDKQYLLDAISNTFSKKPDAIPMNMLAAEKAMLIVKPVFNLKPIKKQDRVQIDGNTAAAIGKIAGGIGFQSYYPITPASDESVYLEANQTVDTVVDGVKSSRPVVVVQTEDEISAIGMAIGAGLAGVRSATATSGPGFALMAEALSWAGQTETPVVVTYYVRGSPSTGLPTRSGQSDLKFAVNVGHGEFPKIVLASGDHAEVFHDAILAFNLAEAYQTPVIHIIEKSIANTYSTLEKADLDYSNDKIDRGALVHLDPGNDYNRYSLENGPISPRSPLGSSISWHSGDEHSESGHISENSANRTIMYEKRMKKLEKAAKEIPEKEKLSIFGDSTAENAVITFGSPKGALKDILEDLASEDKIKLQVIQVRFFSPFPTEELAKVLQNKKRVIDVENNYTAQLGSFVSEHLHITPTHFILKWNGRQMNTDELKDAIKRAVLNDERRIVLNSGM